jgi:ubiquinone/menaquinone biosynthesis C-methylase UbiE
MPAPLGPQKKEQPSTYIVQDRENKEELARLALQDHLLTSAMGGVLPEQPDPARFRRVLDIGCGTGGWAIETAGAYPHMSLIGIDISNRMVEYAHKQARARQVADRVEFRVMDALHRLEFPDGFFDLVNLRLGGSFLRTWDWSKILGEMLRVTNAGGVIRITDQEIMHQSNSPATTQINEVVLLAFYQAGHLFSRESTGLTAQLPRLLTQHGCVDVQTKLYTLEFRAGTPEGETYSENLAIASRTLGPFIQKWINLNNLNEDFETLYQRSLEERKRPDFHSHWNFLCVWGKKP